MENECINFDKVSIDPKVSIMSDPVKLSMIIKSKYQIDVKLSIKV